MNTPRHLLNLMINTAMIVRRITVGTTAAMMTGTKFDEDEEEDDGGGGDDDDPIAYPKQCERISIIDTETTNYMKQRNSPKDIYVYFHVIMNPLQTNPRGESHSSLAYCLTLKHCT